MKQIRNILKFYSNKNNSKDSKIIIRFVVPVPFSDTGRNKGCNVQVEKL